jgi:hypothetical protein
MLGRTWQDVTREVTSRQGFSSSDSFPMGFLACLYAQVSHIKQGEHEAHCVSPPRVATARCTSYVVLWKGVKGKGTSHRYGTAPWQ